MRGLAFLTFGVAIAAAAPVFAAAPFDPPPYEPACKPCWIEPWYCKGPPCPPRPQPPRPSTGPDAEPVRPPPVHMRLTGVVTSFGIVQEEPQETPQASFYLVVTGVDGARGKVLVDMPATRFHCGEGDRATLEGDVPPDEAMAPTILMRARLVSCDRGEL